MRVYEASLSYRLVHAGEPCVLSNPPQVLAYMRSAYEQSPLQEAFWIIPLDTKGHPLGRLMISLGTLNASLVHPREVFRAALLASAASFVASHNHPSGDPAPSRADIQITHTLREAGTLIGVELLDHVIVGHPEADPTKRGYFSFREAGLL